MRFMFGVVVWGVVVVAVNVAFLTVALRTDDGIEASYVADPR